MSSEIPSSLRRAALAAALGCALSVLAQTAGTPAQRQGGPPVQDQFLSPDGPPDFDGPPPFGSDGFGPGGPGPGGFGGMMQTMSADDYVGKRICLSGGI